MDNMKLCLFACFSALLVGGLSRSTSLSHPKALKAAQLRVEQDNRALIEQELANGTLQVADALVTNFVHETIGDTTIPVYVTHDQRLFYSPAAARLKQILITPVINDVIHGKRDEFSGAFTPAEFKDYVQNMKEPLNAKKLYHICYATLSLNEIKAVLLHEHAHIKNKDFVCDYVIAETLGELFYDLGVISEKELEDTETITGNMIRHIDRAVEHRADENVMEEAVPTEILHAYISFFEKIAYIESRGTKKGTHPQATERIARLQAALQNRNELC